MLSVISKWGNSQGVRISKKLLQSARLEVNDEVEIIEKDGALIITSMSLKPLVWYLDGYDEESDRYDWGCSDEPKGRELL